MTDSSEQPKAHVNLQYETMSPAEPGQWCDKCNLPSAIRQDFALSVVGSAPEAENNVGYALVTMLLCADCGGTKMEQATK